MVLRSKIKCTRLCIYLIVTLIITTVCLILIGMDGPQVIDNTKYGLLREPVKDRISRNKLVSIDTNISRVKGHPTYKNNSKPLTIVLTGDHHESVVQIDSRVLKMIEEIEQSDTSRKRMTHVGTMDNYTYTCKGTPQIYKGVEDLLCMQPPKFLPNYKNPCWITAKGVFKCLPYFQVIGMDKCGTTDLFDRIAKHPDVMKNGGALEKETQWWSWKRYGHWLRSPIRIQSFERYTQYFTTAAKTIQSQPGAGIITGDGTPMDMWDMSGWQKIPQNKGLKEPEVITAHLFKHINPRVKLIVILRDPVERLFSDYFFLKLGRMSVKGFHDEVLKSIERMHACTRNSSLRTCLYSRQLIVKQVARIHLGFYAIFLQDWLKVFPREQILILRTEDYSKDTKDHLHQLFKFLGLRDLPDLFTDKIVKDSRKYVTKSKKKAGKMMPQTRAILNRLFVNYNKRLAEILQDDRFLWKS